jgi:hypothetical protein
VHRDGFVARMSDPNQEASVEFYSVPPLESQRQYMSKYFSGSTGSSTLKVAA